MRRRSGFGWFQLLIGIVLIVLGIWAFADPEQALKGMVIAYGFAAVTLGIGDILMFIRIERYTGFIPGLSLVSGILSVMCGIMLVAYPSSGVLVLTLLFPIWFIAHCISRLAHINSIRVIAGRAISYFILTINVIGLILGLLMFMSPLFTINAISLFASLYLILLGVDAVVTAISPMGWRR